MELSDDQIAELKQQHGVFLQLEVFDGTDGEDVQIVLKPPSAVAYKRFIDERDERKVMASTTIQAFVDPCVVYPSKDAYKKLTEELSGIRVSLSVTLQKMAGGQGARESKKL